ncbi:hypothetical protein MPER_12575 [Moniliophthora perniciosa FA553]|nr:hypothetical protein MPER_12575 [Moniliophthora perniciosa FA553]
MYGWSDAVLLRIPRIKLEHQATNGLGPRVWKRARFTKYFCFGVSKVTRSHSMAAQGATVAMRMKKIDPGCTLHNTRVMKQMKSLLLDPFGQTCSESAGTFGSHLESPTERFSLYYRSAAQ